MPYNSKPENKKSAGQSEDIRVPPIPKQTAGAVTGAAIGSIAGPVGAVVGGVFGALAGKAASSGRPVQAARCATAVSKGPLKRQPVKKSPTTSRKAGGRRLHAKGASRTRSRKSSAAKAQKRTVRAPGKLVRSRQKSTSSGARQKRRGGRSKRH
jgi:hypothetical protein